MSITLSPRGGEVSQPPYEFEPAEYMDAVRRFLHENGAGAVRNPATNEVRLQAAQEEAASRAFVAEEHAALGDGSAGSEEAEWISEGFSTVMTRLVKVSAKASRDNPAMTPFGQMDPEVQDAVRQHVFGEYMELSSMFVSEGRAPSKGTYKMSPVLYHGPEEVRRLAAENEDLGSYNVIRAIRHHPLDTEEYFERVRDEVERAVQKFPAISRAEICIQVLYTPNHYEKNLRRYAERKGLRLDTGGTPEEPAALDPGSFLKTLRGLIRGRQYDLSHLKPPAELVETAGRLGREALEAVNGSGEALDEGLRDAFRKRVELLAIVANKAWKKGDVDVALERSPEEFRGGLYTRLLGDFTAINAEVNGHSDADRLTLFYDPGEVKKMAAANPDMPTHVLVYTMLRNPDSPEQAMEEFRTRLDQVREAHPRLNEAEAVRMALWNSDIAPDDRAPEAKEKRAPLELIEDMRDYLGTHSNAINAMTKRTRAELERRRPEIQDFFESAGWTFAGIELPPVARTALIKKVEEFLIANERAFRDGGVSTRSGDFSEEERLALYGGFAEDYARMISLPGFDTATAYRKAPVLYMSADRLEAIRDRHDWMGDRDFATVAVKNPTSLEPALERIIEARASLKLTYPGLSDAFISEIAVKSPATAPKNAIARIRRSSEWEFGRSSDLMTEPTGKDSYKLYKHLRALAKHNRIPRFNSFDQETEDRIAEFRSKAAERIGRLSGSADIDDKQIDRILDQVEHYVRISETLHQEDSYPSVLDLPTVSRNSFVKRVYSNQVELNRLTAIQANGSWKFRVHSFGFFHDAGYLSKLWERYEGYMPQRLITFAALMSPRRPIDRLNGMVEYRARLLRGNPDLSAEDLNKATLAKMQELSRG